MVGQFTTTAGWMRLPWLDRLNSPVYVLAWRFRDDGGKDPWTRRINAFKGGDVNACAGAARVLLSALPKLMQQEGWDPLETGVTATLSSSDTACVLTKTLPTLGGIVAGRLRLRWLPDILSKQVHPPMHSVFAVDKRDAIAVQANYRCSKISGLKHLIILDDIVTLGNTFKNIVNAVHEANPTIKVHCIGLGKSEKLEFARSRAVELTNEHVPAAWATLWDHQ